MKPRITICLWFDKDAHEAARTYGWSVAYDLSPRSLMANLLKRITEAL